MKRWICKTEEETAAAGREIASLIPAEAVVHLIGDLGAGKTFLARAIAGARGADPKEVASPSFAIVHEYPLPSAPPIIHIDGYRLSDRPREWMEIGIPEMLSGPGLKLVEWPKEEFRRFEDAQVEIEVRVADDFSREVLLKI